MFRENLPFDAKREFIRSNSLAIMNVENFKYLVINSILIVAKEITMVIIKKITQKHDRMSL